MKEHNYIRRKSNKQEAQTAKDYGGKIRPGSGNKEFAKGDVRTGQRTTSFNVDDFLIENKFTDAPAFKLTVATWKKIAGEALRENMRTPMMQITVQNTELVVIDSDDFLALGLWKEVVPETIRTIQNKSVSLHASHFEPKIENSVNYAESIKFPIENLHLVVMGNDDLKRILF